MGVLNESYDLGDLYLVDIQFHMNVDDIKPYIFPEMLVEHEDEKCMEINLAVNFINTICGFPEYMLTTEMWHILSQSLFKCNTVLYSKKNLTYEVCTDTGMTLITFILRKDILNQ